MATGDLNRNHARECTVPPYLEPLPEKDSTGQRIVVIDAGCREIFDRAVRVLRAENKIGSDTTGEIVRSGVRYKMGEAHLDALKEEFAREEGSRNGE